ncbi:hypothetical protein AA313_de0204986 [Arthrobotrys entomopaga]|nr:hypothetical protein AA313_de0204986 [Arthrobotrys entomopaga]
MFGGQHRKITRRTSFKITGIINVPVWRYIDSLSGLHQNLPIELSIMYIQLLLPMTRLKGYSISMRIQRIFKQTNEQNGSIPRPITILKMKNRFPIDDRSLTKETVK